MSSKKTNRLKAVVLVAILVPLVCRSSAWSQEGASDAVDVNVRYFQTKLQLAQHDLQSALNVNRRIPNLNTKLTMVRLRNQVKYATKLVEQAMTKDVDDLHMAHLRSVENDVAIADQQLRWAEESNRKYSDTVGKDELKRLRLSLQLARLGFERAKDPKMMTDPMYHFQWQIDRLRSEVLSLQIEFERNRSSH